MEEGVSNATRYPHLGIFHSGGGVCTRLVSSMTNIALTDTSAGRSRVTDNAGARTTTTIKGLVTRHSITGNVGGMIFSHNNCLCRNHIRTLTRTTHRGKLSF